QAAAIIKETASSDVNLIFGAVVDENMGDNIRITVIATGFDRSAPTTEAEQSFFRQSSSHRPVDRLSTNDQPARNLENTQTVATKQEEYVFTSDVDVDMPAFLRRSKNSR
ncbi:MAG: cell division protein FtsZ, partial [Anaerolineaceae bacterium]|nr:cell division protein FtsZ [Anaerolineaceae bacterium]